MSDEPRLLHEPSICRYLDELSHVNSNENGQNLGGDFNFSDDKDDEDEEFDDASFWDTRRANMKLS